ncbi:MAG: S8 family serine peptidase [Chloroflexota bacterium]|nr:S8 family serine peptidase [Chloroflexota bacterium]
MRRRPRERIHPRLRSQIAERSEDETELVLINFRDDLRLPRFPEANIDEPRDSVSNREALGRASELIQEISNRRRDNHERLRNDLRERYQAEILETFWLVNAVLVSVRLGRVRDLAARDDVLYVEPQISGEAPPADLNPNNDVEDARAQMVTDWYFKLGQTGGRIGLLDTGLHSNHTLFNNPSNIDSRRDCVNGGADCNSGDQQNPEDDCWNHGTSSAAIISGNGNLGEPYRGVTAITLDSFKVYPPGCVGLDTAAAVRGFQAALAALDEVIVAEIQSNGDDLSTISTAADNAFDAGAVIIAANGNNGPDLRTVNAPAIAHRVIGVGNIDVQSQAQIKSQSRGPAPDNRIKPDIQAPTNSETASNASDTALHVFPGTSGAAPYAAGAAALLRNWLRHTGQSLDPGQTYAHLILSGQRSFPFDSTTGAGPLRLPSDGSVWWGKVSITDKVTIDIPLSISGGSPNTFDGALWWPEYVSSSPLGRVDVHNNVDLYLVDPNGAVQASSTSVPSVFERARVGGPVTEGTWKLRIRGQSVPGGSQTVYWAAHVRLA